MEKEDNTASTVNDKRKQNFGLTANEFSQLCDQLRRGNDDLFRQIFLAHFSACTQYLEKNLNANPVDAYDAAIDTLLEFCKRIKLGKVEYGNLRFLFTRMASQSLYRIRKKRIPLSELSGYEQHLETPDGPDSDTLDILNKAWNKLGALCQQLLRGFYYDNTPLNELALAIEKSEVATRKQKQRCMQKLQTHFKQLNP